jgi:hypothetical protein
MLIDPAEGEIEGQNLLSRDVAPNDIMRKAGNSGDWITSASLASEYLPCMVNY